MKRFDTKLILILIGILGIPVFLIVYLSLSNIFWWHTSGDTDNGIFTDIVNPKTFIKTYTICKKTENEPFSYIYPSVKADINKNQRIILETKEGFGVEVKYIENTKDLSLGFLFTQVSHFVDKKANTTRIIIYPETTMSGQEYEFLRNANVEELQNYMPDIEYGSGWKFGNKIKIKMAYSPIGSDCIYPYTLEYNIKKID